MAKYVRQPGRAIGRVDDDDPLFHITIPRDPNTNGYTGLLPVEGDGMSHYIVELLNKAGGTAAFEKYMKRYMANPRSGRPRRTQRRKGLIRDMQFFRRHGGGVVGEAARGALSLARAEREMTKRGWTVEWVPDDNADWSWLDQPGFEREKAKEHEVYGAVLKDRHGKVLASLWGIFDPDRHYMRVVEAELASEALP